MYGVLLSFTDCFVGFVGYSALKSASNAFFLDRDTEEEGRKRRKKKYAKEERNEIARHVLTHFCNQKCLYYKI
jgi:hypothetical protein